ncbi:MAG: nucleotide exchange factor GrpE [Eubacterium sp.]|nr:nucleotide exchange factor GrpE [Eubacterium sp.]
MKDKKMEKDVLKDVEETVETEATEETAETTEESAAEETADVCSEEEQGEEKEADSEEDAEEKKDPKDAKFEELNDKYQRLFAEFQNFRNRSEKEKASMFDMGARNIIEKILPVVDNFERGIATLKEEDLESPVGQGMDMIYKQLSKTLEELGVEAIEAEGKEFDPELHNAVMQVENEELDENTVAQELQKGYIYKGTVIRHSMVSVVTK